MHDSLRWRSKTRCGRPPSAGGLFCADEGDFNALATVGAGDIDDERSAHHALRHRRHHRVDVIESAVERVYPVHQFADVGITARAFCLVATVFRLCGSSSQYQDNLQSMLMTLYGRTAGVSKNAGAGVTVE